MVKLFVRIFQINLFHYVNYFLIFFSKNTEGSLFFEKIKKKLSKIKTKLIAFNR